MRRIIRNYTVTTRKPYTEWQNDEDQYEFDLIERQTGAGSNILIEDDFLIDHFNLDSSYWKTVGETVDYLDYAISSLGLLINMLHLFILTRKELRSNVVFIIMTGICLCDMASFLKPVTSGTLETGIFYPIYPECDTDDEKGRPYSHTLIIWLLDTIQTTGRASSALLSLAITSFRAFSVKFPMSSLVATFMKARNGVLSVIVICALCTLWKMYFYLQKTIEMSNQKCYSYYTRHYLKMKSSADAFMKLIDGYFEVVLTFSYLFITSILLWELKKANDRRKHLKSESADKNSTSQLIVWMSIFFLLSHFFFGFYYLIDKHFFRYVYGFEKLEKVLRESSGVFQILLTLNSSIHCFICLLMSSQYRDVFKIVLGWRDNHHSSKISFVVSMDPKTSASS